MILEKDLFNLPPPPPFGGISPVGGGSKGGLRPLNPACGAAPTTHFLLDLSTPFRAADGYSVTPFCLSSSLALSTESTPVAFLIGANS